ncbi:hypothetical protein [Peribacillus muralis]|uniref:hypothetical protein n=1 Tax=Peribacillus muralis TaxID=264697 RepID=UPI00070EF5EA|nr:hypothetical protein [Peribacillus muralis]
MKVNQDMLKLRYTSRVVQEVQRRLNISEREAEDRLQNTAYNKLMDSDPEFVMHYPARVWVDKLFKFEFAHNH